MVLLTFVGGGVFGNKTYWINEAIRQACYKFRNVDLDVRLVCYAAPDSQTKDFVKSLNEDLKRPKHELEQLTQD